MGFGFNMFFLFVLLPGSALLVLLAVLTQKTFFLKLLGGVWAGVFGLVGTAWLAQALMPSNELEKADYYGSYIIDRSKFPGKQADWQFNTFRFEITSNDRITFHVMDGSASVQTYYGTISTVKPYSSHRLVVSMKQPTHHILASNPTVYRHNGNFYLVFESPRFGNVFFTKGNWKPL
ncbi:hypothetical protein [Hymenobacter tenuis]